MASDNTTTYDGVDLANAEPYSGDLIESRIDTIRGAVAHMLPKTGMEQTGENTHRHVHDFAESGATLAYLNMEPGVKADVYGRVELDEPKELSNTKSLHGLFHLRNEEPTMYTFDPDPGDGGMVLSVGFHSQGIEYMVDVWIPVPETEDV